MTRILILEDDEEWVDIIKKSLPDNFDFDHTDNIEEVQRLLQKNSYDLIVADLNLKPEDEFHNIFDDINKLIFFIQQIDSAGQLRPQIIVVTVHPTEDEIPKLLNSWGGWICGWYEKQNFDMGIFLPNVAKVLETRRTFEQDFKSLDKIPPDKWSLRELFDILSHMGLGDLSVIGGALLGLLMFAYYLGTRIP